MNDPFACDGCSETYQGHWRSPDDPGRCRTCAAKAVGACVWPDHPDHLAEHPCSYGTEKPGDPCRYCGDPVPPDGSACRRCWQPMTVPMFKALMAAEGLDTKLTREDL